MQEEHHRKQSFNKVAFEFYDTDRDGILSVLDLIKAQNYFDEESPIGKEIANMMEIYKNKNIRPKYVRHPYEITFEKFHKILKNQESVIV